MNGMDAWLVLDRNIVCKEVAIFVVGVMRLVFLKSSTRVYYLVLVIVLHDYIRLSNKVFELSLLGHSIYFSS